MLCKTAKQSTLTVYDLGIPTPKPYRLVTDGERLGAEYEFITGKRSFARILSQEPEKMQETLVAFWDTFLPVYLGTNDSAALGEYTRKIMAYYAVKVPFMFSLINHDKFPEEGCKSLIKLIW